MDSGGPLDHTGREVSKDTITDTMMEGIGIGSYLIINAESLDDAARIMQGSPHMALGGRFIVRPRLDGSNRDPTYTPHDHGLRLVDPPWPSSGATCG